MSYESAIAALFELGHELARTPSHKFDLAHMRVLLDALGNPQNKFRSVLVAGTNGKGSTAATLASIARAAGHRTGLYTSPHLVRVNERIRVNGAEIEDEDFAGAYRIVEDKSQELIAKGHLPWHPSFFEMLTAMAFVHFASVGIDVAVLEVGMGGRLDATNVVEPLVSVITDIDLDHQKFLGSTIAEIAAEKAGILREGGLLVTLPQHPQANDAIGRAAVERRARAVSASPYVPPLTPGEDWGGKNRYPLRVMDQDIVVDSPLVGRHQMRNIALAITAAEQLNQLGVGLSASDIERGIKDTKWAGRFEVIPPAEGHPEMVLDVAHNPAGAWALRSALSDRYEGRKITLLFGVLRDKAVQDIAEILFPIAEHVVVTAVDNPRSASVEEMAEAATRTGTEVVRAASVSDGIGKARALAGTEGVVVVTGSIYLVGATLGNLQK
jgi:dihydrofolate synthase/folylpolyglutamate synthase